MTYRLALHVEAAQTVRQLLLVVRVEFVAGPLVALDVDLAFAHAAGAVRPIVRGPAQPLAFAFGGVEVSNGLRDTDGLHGVHGACAREGVVVTNDDGRSDGGDPAGEDEGG